MHTQIMESKELPEPYLSSSSSPFSSSKKWWSRETVAIVTGANKGIGYAVVKKLAELGLTVILTARDAGRGMKAVESLRSQGLDVNFFTLDVSDLSSINSFVSWFKINFGALDILVNNAGVSFNDIDENSVDNAETVMKTNFYGAKLLTEALLPMFRCSSSISRILNISSRLGSINKVKNPNIKQALQNEDLTVEVIDKIVESFLEDVKNGSWKDKGWPEIWTDYAMSKLALNAYSKVLAKRYEGRWISVNCYCPGYTKTSMTRDKGTHTADEAAEIGVRLLLRPPEELPTAKFYKGFGPFVKSKL